MKFFFSLLIIMLPIAANSQMQQIPPIKQRIDSAEQTIKEQIIYLGLKEKRLDDKEKFLNIYLVISTIFVTLVGVGLTFIVNREHKRQFEEIRKTKSDVMDSVKDDLEKFKENEKKQIQEFENEQKQKNEIETKQKELSQFSVENNKKKVKEKLNKIMEDIRDYEKTESKKNTINILNDCNYQFIIDWSNAFIDYCDERYKDAESKFQQLLKDYSNEMNYIDLSNIYRCLSVCYIVQNEVERALSFAESAVLYNPNNYLAWNNKGVYLSAFGKKEEALRCFEFSIKLYSLVDNVWYNKSADLDDLNRKEEAMIALDRCLEITPDYEIALILKGCILYSKGEKEQAEEIFNRVNPKYVPNKHLEEVKRIYNKYGLQERLINFLKRRKNSRRNN